MTKIGIDQASIEITRRCNMSCDHCLRGDAQNIDIDPLYLKFFFGKCHTINSLTISGGEPSLNVPAILKIVEYIKEFEVDVRDFYIATNGKKVEFEFLEAIMLLYSVCTDNEMSSVQLSSDPYHEEVPRENKRLLSVFSFFTDRDWEVEKRGKKYNYSYDRTLINEGRAMDNTDAERVVSADEYIIEEDNIMEGVVYLNAIGKIIAGCDFSYERQDCDENLQICDVDMLSLEAFEDFKA